MPSGLYTVFRPPVAEGAQPQISVATLNSEELRLLSSTLSAQPPSTPASGYELLSPEGRSAAIDAGLTPTEASQALLQLPHLDSQAHGLQDLRWFHGEWLLQQQQGPAGDAAFHLPGPETPEGQLVRWWLQDGVRGQLNDTWPGTRIAQVNIDSGVFKYVLMRLRDRESNEPRSKLLVWGDTRAPYHMDVLRAASGAAARCEGGSGLVLEPLGGGRIEHYPGSGVMHIYGFSAAFGPAPHEVSAALIRKWYPTYDPRAIVVSYKGY